MHNASIARTRFTRFSVARPCTTHVSWKMLCTEYHCPSASVTAGDTPYRFIAVTQGAYLGTRLTSFGNKSRVDSKLHNRRRWVPSHLSIFDAFPELHHRRVSYFWVVQPTCEDDEVNPGSLSRSGELKQLVLNSSISQSLDGYESEVDSRKDVCQQGTIMFSPAEHRCACRHK